MIQADKEQVYIADYKYRTFSIISRSGYKQVKTFAGLGEGPGEFKFFHFFQVCDAGVAVTDMTKWVLFSKTGEFVREKKKPLSLKFLGVVKDHFVTLTSRPEDKSNTRIQLLDNEFNLIKEISNRKDQGRQRSLTPITHCYMYQIEGDKIFIGNTLKGFSLDIFDGNGNKIRQIKRPYTPQKVSATFKTNYVKTFWKKKDMITNALKKRGYTHRFPDVFPAYEFFKVDNGKIYFFTYRFNQQNEREVTITDLKGNLLHKTYIPKISERKSCISNDQLLYLQENENSGEWELHSTDLSK